MWKGEGEGLAGNLVGDVNASNPRTSPSEARAGTLGSAKDGSTPSTRTSQTILLRAVRRGNQKTVMSKKTRTRFTAPKR